MDRAWQKTKNPILSDMGGPGNRPKSLIWRAWKGVWKTAKNTILEA